MPRSTPDASAREPHKTDATAHTLLEDAQAYILGTALCALGVHLLQSSGLITGQTAGLGVLLAYVSDWSFGIWFFLLNVPFYVLGWLRLGPKFVLRTVIAVSMVSLATMLLPPLLVIEPANPWITSFLAGAVNGMGLIVIFRHGASLGGIGILALWLQETTGIKAGWVQLGFDLALFAVALFLLDPWLVLASTFGAVVTNLIVAVNHRKDRYIGR